MNKSHEIAIHHEILKRKIALEEANEMFKGLTGANSFVKMQVFHPEGRSKLIRIPAISAFVAIESALRQVKKELAEYEQNVLHLQ